MQILLCQPKTLRYSRKLQELAQSARPERRPAHLPNKHRPPFIIGNDSKPDVQTRKRQMHVVEPKQSRVDRRGMFDFETARPECAAPRSTQATFISSATDRIGVRAGGRPSEKRNAGVKDQSSPLDCSQESIRHILWPPLCLQKSLNLHMRQFRDGKMSSSNLLIEAAPTDVTVNIEPSGVGNVQLSPIAIFVNLRFVLTVTRWAHRGKRIGELC